MLDEEQLLSTNWNDIKFFLALARHRRLTLAAKTLDSSHVTVGNRVRALEATVGIQLFVRTDLGFELTDAGNCFARYAEDLESSLKRGLVTLGELGHSTPRVRVGVTEGLGGNYLARRIVPSVANGEFNIDFISLPRSTNITTHETDISITLEEPHGELIIRRLLTEYTLSIYASAEYFERHIPIRHKQQLLEHEWIGYIDNYIFTNELRYHSEISPNLKFVFRSTTIEAQKKAAIAGVGLSILPDYMAADDTRLVRVLGNMRFVRNYWISSNRDLHRLAAVRHVWRLILDCCHADQEIFYRIPEDDPQDDS